MNISFLDIHTSICNISSYVDRNDIPLEAKQLQFYLKSGYAHAVSDSEMERRRKYWIRLLFRRGTLISKQFLLRSAVESGTFRVRYVFETV